MITLLYNLDTQTPGDAREGRYIVDGKTGVFPSNFVELVVEDPPVPQYDAATQKIEFSNHYANIEKLLWTRDITVVQKSQQEIDAENASEVARQKEEAYQNTINTGYQIPGTSIYLGITDGDRVAWSQLLTLINELLSLGQMSPSTELTLVDKNGVPHLFPASQVKEILAGLGMYYYTLWVQKNASN